ncbi:gasdermin-A [Pogona vitticeps]
MTFHKTTKSLAKQLDPEGELIPVHSIIDQSSFRPLCLVQRKLKTSSWQTCRFRKTDYKLYDILLSEDIPAELDVQESVSITIVDQIDGTLEGAMGEPLNIMTVDIKGSASMSHTRTVKVKKIHICPKVLDSVIEKAKIKMDHGFIEQSKRLQRNLYVITEAIETTEEARFEEASKMEGSIFYKTCVKMHLMGTRKENKALIVPKSCILAFRAKRLQLLRGGSIGISYYPDDKTKTFDISYYSDDKTKMFGASRTIMCASRNRSIDLRINGFEMMKGKRRTFQTDEGYKKDDLQMEVQQECMQFSLLARDLCSRFLTVFLAIMKDNEKHLLQTLEFQLEQALEDRLQFKLKTDEPELQDLVVNLLDSSGAIIVDLVEAVLYFLQALDELTELQLWLLAESVEKKIVSKEVTLVKSILDHKFSKKGGSFTIDVQSLTEEELNITGAMIEMSRVTIQKTGLSLVLTGEAAALSDLNALYVALYVLSLLSK